MEEIRVVPDAATLMESTRSIGYSFEAAVADIIDNSISAGALEVRVCFMSQEPQWLCIEDDGWGMTADELENAMRYGSQSPRDVRRKDDMGRFGLGLKMASLSQCRRLTVLTKKNGEVCAACWDMDYVIQQGDWALKFYTGDEVKNMYGYSWLNVHESGTAVLWEQFDRLQQESANVQKAFDEKIQITRKHVSLVFHRFLGDDNPKNRLAIYFNGEAVVGIDPFLTKHPATQPLYEQVLRIGPDEIRVKPYVLPYINKMSKKDLDIIGGKDELRQQQGFYVYRNRRLIIWGTWFRLIRQNELGKLARVRVDIPNSLDSIWDIDVRKSRASLPHFIRKSLADIVENTVGRSERVYKYRGRNVQTDDLIHVWNPIEERGRLRYQINRDLPMLKMIEDHMDEEGSAMLDSLITMMEDTFPYADVYYRMAKSEVSDTGSDTEDNVVYAMAERIVQQVETAGGDAGAAVKMLEKTDFFVKYPDVIRQIKEVYDND